MAGRIDLAPTSFLAVEPRRLIEDPARLGDYVLLVQTANPSTTATSVVAISRVRRLKRRIDRICPTKARRQVLRTKMRVTNAVGANRR
jgi:hypothetical protein